VVLNTSNVFVFGNTASGNALSVQQLGTGNVATFRTTTGATALFVNAAGNVGIGTVNPSYQLSVATGLGATATPTVQIADTVGPKSLSVIPNASSGVYNAMVATGDTLVVAGAGTTVNTGVLTLAPWSGSSVGARIGGSSNIFGIYSNATTFYSNAVSPATVMTLVNGNVGIGNTTPPVKLWVPATSTTTGIGVYNSDVALIIGNAAGGTSTGTIQVKSSGSSSAIGATNYRLALNPDGGTVGIGTASPEYPLHVSDGTTTTKTLGAFLQPSLATGGNFSTIQVGGGAATSRSAVLLFQNNGSNSSNVAQVSLNGSGSTAINITTTGVGIGGIASTTLDVIGRVRSTQDFMAESTATGGNYSVVRLATGSNGANYIQSAAEQSSGSAAPLVFTGWFGSPEFMRITSAGNVGIGTASPSTRLSVEGAISTTGRYDTGTTLNVNVNDAAFTTDYLNGAVLGLNVRQTQNGGYRFCQFNSGYSPNGGGALDAEFIVYGNGNVTADGSYTSPADYAEMFEWEDGNPDGEDRVGYSVILSSGNKIRKSESTDSPDLLIGVISGRPAVCADTAWNRWADKYLKDDFNRYLMEEYEVWKWTDDDGKEISYDFDKVPEGVIVPENKTVIVQERYVLNPNYDPSVVYTPRMERKEWSPVGMVGKLSLLSGQLTGPRWIKMVDFSPSVSQWLIR
jgi:hypothetical protein